VPIVSRPTRSGETDRPMREVGAKSAKSEAKESQGPNHAFLKQSRRDPKPTAKSTPQILKVTGAKINVKREGTEKKRWGRTGNAIEQRLQSPDRIPK